MDNSGGAVGSPRVCIVLATHEPNIAFLREQVESIRAQSYSNWICVVQDDASSGDLYKGIEQTIGNDSRFQIERNRERLGAYHTFERGLSRVPADAEYVCFADQDDVWRSDKLEKLVSLLQTSFAVLVHSDLSLIDDRGEKLHASCWKWEGRKIGGESFPLLLLMNNVTGCAAMFRRRLLDIALPFPPQSDTNPFFLHDWWLALMATERGGIAATREPLVAYRRHSGNTLGAMRRPGAIGESFLLLAEIFSGKFRSALSNCVYHWRKRSELEELARDRLEEHGEAPSKRRLPDRFDFGLSASQFAMHAFLRGYRGPRARIMAGKFLHDLCRMFGKNG